MHQGKILHRHPTETALRNMRGEKGGPVFAKRQPDRASSGDRGGRRSGSARPWRPSIRCCTSGGSEPDTPHALAVRMRIDRRTATSQEARRRGRRRLAAEAPPAAAAGWSVCGGCPGSGSRPGSASSPEGGEDPAPVLHKGARARNTTKNTGRARKLDHAISQVVVSLEGRLTTS